MEEASPAFLVTFARLFVGKMFVDQRQFGATVKRLLLTVQKRSYRLSHSIASCIGPTER